MEINIYIETDIRGLGRRQNGTGLWLVECICSNGRTEIRPREMQDALLTLIDTTENELCLTLAAEALSILTKPCRVKLYTRCEHILNAAQNDWIEQWAKNDWRRANQAAVANADLWRQVWEYMQIHAVQFVEAYEHTYRKVMQMQIRRHEIGGVRNGKKIWSI